MRVSPAVVRAVKMCKDRILIPARTHHAMADVRKYIGFIFRPCALFSIGGNRGEEGIAREELKCSFCIAVHRGVGGIVQTEALKIRPHQAEFRGIHLMDLLHHRLGHLKLKGFAKIHDVEIFLDGNEVIARRQFILEALGIDLHGKLLYKAVKDKLLPLPNSVIEGIEDRNMRKAHQLGKKPVVAGAIIAQMEGVLPNGFEDLHNQQIGDQAVAHKGEDRYLPGHTHTNARLQRSPARVIVRAVTVGDIGNRKLDLIDPAFDQLIEGIGVLFVTRMQVALRKRRELAVARKLPYVFAVVIGRLVGFPVYL